VHTLLTQALFSMYFLHLSLVPQLPPIAERVDIDTEIFVNCNWVDTRWQQYSTYLHKNSI